MLRIMATTMLRSKISSIAITSGTISVSSKLSLSIREFSSASSKKINEIIPHSANDLVDHRFYWWSKEQLDLITQKYSLKKTSNILDVGCGKGHWTYPISYMANEQASIHTVDVESEWVSYMKSMFKPYYKSQTVVSKQAKAESLPYDDQTFDIVTCQTLLIHVNDPSKVIDEMIRVLKKTGKLVIAEPSNLVSAALRNSVTKKLTKEESIKLFELHYTCQQGKINIGEGNISVGDLLLEVLHKKNLKKIDVMLSDRAYYLLPPYEGSAQKALISDMEEKASKGYWIWDKHQSYEYYIAGGGDNNTFNDCWEVVAKVNTMYLHEIHENYFVDAGGQVMYLYHAEVGDMA